MLWSYQGQFVDYCNRDCNNHYVIIAVVVALQHLVDLEGVSSWMNMTSFMANAKSYYSVTKHLFRSPTWFKLMLQYNYNSVMSSVVMEKV